MENLREDTQLRCDWYYDIQGNGRHERVYTTESPANGSGNAWVAFNLFSTQDPLPAGSYKVIISLDDQVQVEREFQIE